MGSYLDETGGIVQQALFVLWLISAIGLVAIGRVAIGRVAIDLVAIDLATVR